MAKALGTVVDLGTPWTGVGPFLFAMHHLDAYPKGNGKMGPDPALLKGREIGMDRRNASGTGWNMYHGTEGIPGFPAHGHRGFETLTYLGSGVVDHADSTGAGARFGKGDSQWITTGKGVVHSEMFPLLNDDEPNPLDLYQIWINLPAKSKMVPPEFKMFWAEETPTIKRDSVGGTAKVTVIAGKYEDVSPLPPPKASWAADPSTDVAVWLIELEPGAAIKLPAPNTAEAKRMLYVHGGDGVRVTIAGTPLSDQQGFLADQGTGPEHRLMVKNIAQKPATILLLQGREIGEPVAQQGPFVMNTQAELQQAYADYQRTRFGGWKWGSDGPTYAKDSPRFADYGDGKKVYPPAAK